MKIVIPNIPYPILTDIAQCLEGIKQQAELEILLWNTDHKSLIDVFDEVQPDLIFLHTSQLDTTFNILCQEFNFKYILIGDEEPPKNINKTPCIKLTQSSFGSNTIQIKPIARVVQIHNGSYKKDMESEILINTTNTPIDQTFYTVAKYLVNNYRTKIVGENKVDLHNYLGKVTAYERADFIKSSRIVIDMGSFDSWDAAYLKIPPLSTNFIDENILQFNNFKLLKSNIDTLLNTEKVRTKYIEKCYTAVCNNNTSYHFTAEIFNKIDEKNIAEISLQYIKALI